MRYSQALLQCLWLSCVEKCSSHITSVQLNWWMCLFICTIYSVFQISSGQDILFSHNAVQHSFFALWSHCNKACICLASPLHLLLYIHLTVRNYNLILMDNLLVCARQKRWDIYEISSCLYLRGHVQLLRGNMLGVNRFIVVVQISACTASLLGHCWTTMTTTTRRHCMSLHLSSM